MEARRLTVFAGHYGSGKTNLALNYALWLRGLGRAVTVADLDIVNPYFRGKDGADRLRAAGIGLVASAFAGSNVDLPALPGEVYALVERRDVYAVLDVGGDDRGALALGRYAPAIRAEGDYEMLFTVNFARPLTATPQAALEVLREIESAGGIPFTAIVNNTNLGAVTREEDVLSGQARARELSALAELPVKMTCAERRLCPALAGQVGELFPLDVLELYYMEKEGNGYGNADI